MERLTDIELVGINVQETQARAYGVVGEKMIGDEFVNTSFGRVHIAVQGTKESKVGFGSVTTHKSIANVVKNHFCDGTVSRALLNKFIASCEVIPINN